LPAGPNFVFIRFFPLAFVIYPIFFPVFLFQKPFDADKPPLFFQNRVDENGCHAAAVAPRISVIKNLVADHGHLAGAKLHSFGPAFKKPPFKGLLAEEIKSSIGNFFRISPTGWSLLLETMIRSKTKFSHL
jgi:hypothetical protein